MIIYYAIIHHETVFVRLGDMRYIIPHKGVTEGPKGAALALGKPPSEAGSGGQRDPLASHREKAHAKVNLNPSHCGYVVHVDLCSVTDSSQQDTSFNLTVS